MAHYNITTAETRKPIKIEWICSNCKEQVSEWVDIEGKGIFYYNGNPRRRRTEAHSIASKMAYSDLYLRYNFIEKSPSSAGLTCCCPKCNHFEPWARVNIALEDQLLFITKTVAVICILLDLLFLYIHKYQPFAITTIIAIIPFVIYALVKKSNQKYSLLTKKLPQESYPKICVSNKQTTPSERGSIWGMPQ